MAAHPAGDNTPDRIGSEIAFGDAWYRILFEQATVGLAHMTLDGHIVAANRCLVDMLGYSRDRLLTMTLADITHPDVLAANWATLRALVASDAPAAVLEKRLICANGTYLPVRVTTSVLRDADRQPRYFGAILEDLSARIRSNEQAAEVARKQAEQEAAAAHAEQLRAIVEAIADGVYVYDADGRPVLANAAACRLIGLHADPDFLARPWEERTALANVRDIRGARIPPDQTPVARILRGEVLTGTATVDMIYRSLDGRDIQANISGAPIRDTSARVAGAVMTVRDVTERRVMEHRVQAALQAILRMAEALVMSPSDLAAGKPENVDWPGTITKRLVELAREVLGCQRVGIIGFEWEAGGNLKSITPVAIAGCTAEDESRWHASVSTWRIGDTGDTTIVERWRRGEVVVIDMDRLRIPQQRRKGLTRARQVLAAPLRIADAILGDLHVDFGEAEHDFSPDEIRLVGTTATLAALVLERERLRHAQTEALRLRELDHLRTDFIATISHDLQTPLTAARAGLGLLEASADSRLTGDERMLLRTARQNIERLRLHIADLLAANRIETGALSIELVEMDLSAVVRRSAEIVAPLLFEKSQSLTLALPDTLPIRGDPRWLEQVLVNLLANAHRHTPGGTRIEVAAEHGVNGASVTVRDTGPGIPENELETVFERFYHRGESSGYGLGLAIARALIERHGGRILAERAPSGGSAFQIHLPQIED